MGGRIARLFRNFNLENRVFRELSKEKPTAAPRHAVPEPPLPGSDGEWAQLSLPHVMCVSFPFGVMMMEEPFTSLLSFQSLSRFDRRTSRSTNSSGPCTWSPQTRLPQQRSERPVLLVLNGLGWFR